MSASQERLWLSSTRFGMDLQVFKIPLAVSSSHKFEWLELWDEVGITDVEFDDRQQVISGDVKYTDKSEDELVMMAIRHTGIRPFYTSTSEGGLTVGALSVWRFILSATTAFLVR